jgi:DNA-directed RNA polymerase subunit RPC12/RpoP
LPVSEADDDEVSPGSFPLMASRPVRVFIPYAHAAAVWALWMCLRANRIDATHPHLPIATLRKPTQAPSQLLHRLGTPPAEPPYGAVMRRRPRWGEAAFSVGLLPVLLDSMPEWYFTRLPASYYEPEVLKNIGPDAQLYYSCSSCNRHWRVNPSLRNEEFGGFTCPCTPARTIDPIRARPRLVYLCKDCGAEYANYANPWDRPGRCPQCLSRKSMVWSAKPLTPRPKTFLSTSLRPAAGEPLHRWSAGTAADLHRLNAEQKLVMDLPDAEQHLIPMARFAAYLRSLAERNSVRMSLMNFEAAMLQKSYKMTMDVTAGWTALRLYWDAAEIARRDAPIAEAPVTHNVAMAAYSLLALRQDMVLASTEDGDLLRTIGLSAAERSLELYEARAATPDVAHEIARVVEVMGDICATGRSRESLAEARHHYDRALAGPWLGAPVRQAITASRRRVDVELSRLANAGSR